MAWAHWRWFARQVAFGQATLERTIERIIVDRLLGRKVDPMGDAQPMKRGPKPPQLDQQVTRTGQTLRRRIVVTPRPAKAKPSRASMPGSGTEPVTDELKSV